MANQVRLVGVDATNSGSIRLLFQIDDGTLSSTRDSFEIQVPGWTGARMRIGEPVCPVTTKASRLEDQAIAQGYVGIVSGIFIFRPGGTADPANGIFTSWISLMAAHNAITMGYRVIFFDTSFGAITIPAGTWDMGNRTSLSAADGQSLPITVTRASGATMPNAIYTSPSLTIV